MEVPQCDIAVSAGRLRALEFPSHFLALQVSNLRVPSSSGSQTHLKSQVWNDFLYLNPFQRNRFWLRGLIHHFPAKLNKPIYPGEQFSPGLQNLEHSGSPRMWSWSPTMWESSVGSRGSSDPCREQRPPKIILPHFWDHQRQEGLLWELLSLL